MYCWKTVNVSKEVGTNRINLLSVILGLLSFLFLYLPFSFVHKDIVLKDYGVFPLILGILLLPMIHKLMHLMPLILCQKRTKVKWYLKNKCFPTFTFTCKQKLSKKTFLFSLLAPTLLITVPGIISSYLFVDYYPYLLLFTSVHIAISLTDFLYIRKMVRAPKKCVVENADDGYDILISRVS